MYNIANICLLAVYWCAQVMEAGDLLLWDSRTVHCNFYGEGSSKSTVDRMSLLVSMTPRQLASPQVLKQRAQLAKRVWVSECVCACVLSGCSVLWLQLVVGEGGRANCANCANCSLNFAAGFRVCIGRLLWPSRFEEVD